MRGETIIARAARLNKNLFQSTPLMRGETCYIGDDGQTVIFQSTPLMRGETQGRNGRNRTARFQSTPLMRGETQTAARGLCARPHFNPLPSCEGRRQANYAIDRWNLTFQSTPLMRGETLPDSKLEIDYNISIHSPHARGDVGQF